GGWSGDRAVGGQRTFERDRVEEVLIEERRKPPAFINRQFVELSPLFDRIDDYATYDLMGFAEFQSLADEVIGQVGGVGVIGNGGQARAFAVEFDIAEDRRRHAQAAGERVNCVEEGLFVFLQVLVVS